MQPLGCFLSLMHHCVCAHGRPTEAFWTGCRMTALVLQRTEPGASGELWDGSLFFPIKVPPLASPHPLRQFASRIREGEAGPCLIQIKKTGDSFGKPKLEKNHPQHFENISALALVITTRRDIRPQINLSSFPNLFPSTTRPRRSCLPQRHSLSSARNDRAAPRRTSSNNTGFHGAHCWRRARARAPARMLRHGGGSSSARSTGSGEAAPGRLGWLLSGLSFISCAALPVTELCSLEVSSRLMFWVPTISFITCPFIDLLCLILDSCTQSIRFFHPPAAALLRAAAAWPLHDGMMRALPRHRIPPRRSAWEECILPLLL